MFRYFGHHCSLAAALTSFVLSCLPLSAQGPQPPWSRFRGENASGAIAKCEVPLPWKAKDVAWTIDLPGQGNGSPVVFGDRVFIFSADSKTAKRYVTAYELASGKQLWQQSYDSQPHHLHARSSYASGTPAVDEKGVYIAWASPENVVLKALDHDGGELWTRELGRYVSQHGFGASPALFGDLVVLFNSQQAEQMGKGEKPGESRVMAFDRNSGNPVWETKLNATRACYGLPSLFQDESGQDALLFSNTGNGLFAIRLDNGEMLWSQPVLSKRSVSCPLVVGDLAIGTEGSGGGGNKLFAVDLKGDHQVKFKIERSAPYVPTPVRKGDLLFLWDDRGIVSSVRLPDGEVVWSKRIGGNVSSSPVIAGDKLIGIAEDGTVTVLSASADFKKFGTVKLEETTRATPLLSENYILVRTESRLHCVGDPTVR